MPLLKTADLFCGGGGASLGLRYAANSLGYKVQGVGINHWPRAIEAYKEAFPSHQTYTTGVEEVDPHEAVPGGHLNLMVAGPSCTHHSRARGGTPSSEQYRTGPWSVLNWMRELEVNGVLVENVPEFAEWRPLTRKGRPDKRYSKGHTFNKWMNQLHNAGYTVDWKVVCAADYGDATSRRRLFMQCVKGRNKKITWPGHTHGPETPRPYRTARDIIDWSLEGRSVFGRKRPLSPNTMNRIRIGIERFVTDPGLREAFLVILRGGGCKGGGGVKPVDIPLSTITSAGSHHGVVQTYLTKFHGGKSGATRAHSIDEPIRTIDTSNRFGIAEAFAMAIDNSGDSSANSRGLDRPLGTIVTKARHGIVTPHVVELRGKSTARSVDDPLSTVTTMGAHHGVVEPCLVQVNHQGDGKRRVKSVDEPLHTITSRRGTGVLEPYITKYYGTGGAVGVDEPLHTVTTKDRFTLVEPYLVHINRNQLAPTGVDQPMRTVTAQSSDIALIETGYLVQDTASGQLYLLDIRFRMLQPHELAAAMSLEGMHLPGPKKDQVRLVGNAIPARTAEALTRHMITTYNLA